MAMPLIRYEISDEVELRRGECGCAHPGRWIADVGGRLDDWFHYGDIAVHPHTFRSVLAMHPAVVAYQVTQTAKGAEISVDSARVETDLTIIRDAVAARLERAGMRSPQVIVRHDAALRRHGATAKLRRFIPLEGG